MSNVGLGQAGGLAALELAPAVCTVLIGGGGPGVPPICRAAEELPGGDYGVQLHATIREFSARFGPDGQLPGQLSLLTFISEDELFALVDALVPELTAIVEAARDSVQALEPAAGMEADHERLLRFFDDTLGTLQSITDAAAAADRDGILSGSGELGELRIMTADDLSDTIAPIVIVHFGAVPDSP